MTKPIPTIQKHMTMTPHAIGIDQSVSHAHALMKEHGIRHLPVLNGGELVGVLSERDLARLEAWRDFDPKKMAVDEAMSTEVYAVSPDARLDEVVSTMAERKYGCAVVMDNGHVAGIFTTVDVCRSLAELLHTRLAS